MRAAEVLWKPRLRSVGNERYVAISSALGVLVRYMVGAVTAS